MKPLLAILIIVSLAGCAPDADGEISCARGTFDHYEFSKGRAIVCFEDGRYYWTVTTDPAVIVSKGDSVEVYKRGYDYSQQVRRIPEWREFTDEEKANSLNARCSTKVTLLIIPDSLEEK